MAYAFNDDKSKVNIANLVYPVGSIYMSVNDVNPANLFGGTWVRWGAGRVPVGVDTTQDEFNTVEKIGGEKGHVLSASEMPSHNHNAQDAADGSAFVKVKDVFNASENFANGECGSLPGTGRYYPYVTDIARFRLINNTGNTGGSQAHNNLQPYVTCYMWKRTA